MKVLKKIKARIGLSNKTALHCPPAQPLEFHPVHGDNVLLTQGNTIAARVESFCKAVVFTHRPVRVNEKIFIRFVEKSESWSGSIRFGFSAVDPRQLAGHLPKYACPDLTNRSGFWAKALSEKFADKDSVMYYYVSSSGDVVFGVNGEDKGVFFSGVDTRRQLWGMVDVYGNSNVIQLVDPRRTLNNIRAAAVPRSPAPPSRAESRPESSRLRRSESCGRISAASSSASGFYSQRRLARANFHRACTGQNVTLDASATVATRSETEFCNGYAFLDSPLQPGESLVVRVLETESTYIGSLAFGLTGADPRHLRTTELPEDSDLLAQRPEYWVHTKDVLPDPQEGDELCFTLSLDGAVLCAVNGGPERVLFHADISIPTRPFLDIYGVAQKVQVIGVCPASCRPSSQASSHQANSSIINTSMTPSLRRSSRLSSHPRPKSSCSPSSLDTSLVSTECVICYEADVDCVLYSCGHMCMCFQCAVQQWGGAGECPLCRATIRDVIRTYRA